MFLNTQIEVTNQALVSDHKQQEHTIALKTLTSADLNDFMEWATDDEVTQYMILFPCTL